MGGPLVWNWVTVLTCKRAVKTDVMETHVTAGQHASTTTQITSVTVLEQTLKDLLAILQVSDCQTFKTLLWIRTILTYGCCITTNAGLDSFLTYGCCITTNAGLDPFYYWYSSPLFWMWAFVFNLCPYVTPKTSCCVTILLATTHASVLKLKYINVLP